MKAFLAAAAAIVIISVAATVTLNNVDQGTDRKYSTTDVRLDQ